MDFLFVTIYVLLGAVLFGFTWPAAEDNQAGYKVRLWVAILFFAFVMGCRYNVGVDYLATLDIYEARQDGMTLAYLEYYEPLFRFLTIVMADTGVYFPWYFGVIALLQMYFLFLALRRFPKEFPWIMLFFMLQCVWFFWANGMRQSIAQSIFICSVLLLAEKKYLWYVVWILFGSLWHKSILFMLLILPLYWHRSSYIKFIPLQIAALLFAVSVFVSGASTYLDTFLLWSESWLFGDRYERYFLREGEVLGVDSYGIGFWVLFSINFLLVIFSNAVKKYYQNRAVDIFYDLFFVGVILEYLCLANQLVGRMNVFFINNRFLLCGLYFYFFYKSFLKHQEKAEFSQSTEKYQGLLLLGSALLLLVLNLAVFGGYISRYETSPIVYRFFWEEI